MINVAIYGYGNLGKGVENAIAQNGDMKLFGVFTRRNPSSLTLQTKGASVYSANDVLSFKNDIDVLIICGGSATDLPTMTKTLAKDFNVVDSFDTHADIPSHFSSVDEMAKIGKHVALISCGWDPGMFSLNRVYAQAILPNGKDYTFWGKGVSQGHSDAIRRIVGVQDARQYTCPVEEALDSVRRGEQKDFTTREKHTRLCYVVAKDGADKKAIEEKIKTMPKYFADYDTTVHFISQEELDKNHKGIPHGGVVIRSGNTGKDLENKHVIEYKLTLDSNPEFTASVLVAYARAVYRKFKNGEVGCKTVLDIAPSEISPLSAEELRKTML